MHVACTALWIGYRTRVSLEWGIYLYSGGADLCHGVAADMVADMRDDLPRLVLIVLCLIGVAALLYALR